ncbi:MAG: response regulator, partial [bacterium]|nr:response regulator [bacterium]
HDQNWCVLQDKRGIVYVGNQAGLLEFDGVSWRFIAIPNVTVRSMAMDKNGTVYIGGIGEIGFLAPNKNGTLEYVSLLEHFKPEEKKFFKVWRTHSTGENVYFRTSDYLFRWNPGTKQLKTWKPVNQFNASFQCGGKYYIHDRTTGLMHIVGNSLKPVPGGEQFKAVKIYMMASFQSDSSTKLLIGTRSKRFFIYDTGSVRPFPTEADDYLMEKQLGHGIRLESSPGDFALATLRGGVVIIDSKGRLKQIFDKDSGLQDESVKYVFEDSQGSLWLGLEKGVSRIEYTSPFFVYDDRAGLPGNVQTVVRHGPENHLYTGTSNGLYVLDSSLKFKPVAGMSGYCFSILSISDYLLAAATDGVFLVGGQNGSVKAPRRIIGNSSYVLRRSQMDGSRIWVGTESGLISLYLNPDTRLWSKEFQSGKIFEQIRTIVEDQKGNLWLGTRTRGVLKVDFHDGVSNPGHTVTRYEEDHGLPPNEINVYAAAGHVIFATEKGIFRFDSKEKTFIPDTTLGNVFAGGGRDVFRIARDKNNIWFHSLSENFQAVPGEDGIFALKPTPIDRIPPAQVNTIYPDPDGFNTWFGGNNGLIRYDTQVKKDYRQNYRVFIRRLSANGNPIYGGYDNKHKSLPPIAYTDRNLRFEFAAPFFEDESRTQYRYFLEGYENGWSQWNSETRKDYTNLDSGRYTFRVRAGNVYHHEGGEAVFKFRVLPPWYKTWWAFSTYAVLLILLIYLIVKWRSGKLEKEKQKLEQVIRERTRMINHKSRQLEKQTLQLKDQSEKLRDMAKAKSRFFANISHEFRTPLTLIMGPLEQMLSRSRKKEQKQQMNLMLRNSQRLLTLINQLLDLSRVDSGKMKLQARRQNIVPFLKGILASFEMLALQHKLELEFTADREEIFIYFDTTKMEEVMGNLLANAVKFTPAGGKISVTVKQLPSTDAPGGVIEISVCDTGAGIPKDQLAHIFDRFYQAEGSGSPEHHWEHDLKGSGIGLALTREWVVLHHGRIDVHSREGDNSGTDFIIRLPMGTAHFKPGEIITASEPSPGSPVSRKTPAAGLPYMMAPDQNTEPAKEKAETPGKADAEEPEPREKNVILVVEDNADVRTYIRGSLETHYTVVEAVDGGDGIKKAREIIPDLIISDVMMPGTDGCKLCHTLKNEVDTSHIPIILLTAKAAQESVILGLESGADDYITKPFNTKILCARIKNLIDLRLQFQEKIQRKKRLMPDKISVSSIDEKFLKEFQAVVEKNLSDSDLNIELLCKTLLMGRTSLFRKVEALTGETPNQFIQSYRLERAAQLLKANFGNITDVAFEVGFSSSAYFTKFFRERVHLAENPFATSPASFL